MAREVGMLAIKRLHLPLVAAGDDAAGDTVALEFLEQLDGAREVVVLHVTLEVVEHLGHLRAHLLGGEIGVQDVMQVRPFYHLREALHASGEVPVYRLPKLRVSALGVNQHPIEVE